MKTAIGYARVSTDSQASEGVSLEAQEKRIELWCAANGYRLVAMKVDAGLSGGRADNRPALNEALKQVIAGPHALVVYSLSRLARSTRDTLSISEKLEKAGADLVSLCEKIDTSSASGKMIFRLLAVLAEFERDLTSERTRTAMLHLKRQNRLVGAVPLGFDLAPDRKTLVPNRTEQRVLAQILELRAKGKSLREIKEILERQKTPSKTGGSVWHPSTLSCIIHNHGHAASIRGKEHGPKDIKAQGKEGPRQAHKTRRAEKDAALQPQ